MKKIIEAVQDFFKYTISRRYNDFMYTYYRVPKYKLRLMFKYLKDVDVMPWDCVNVHELVFANFVMFFSECHEHLTPWLEDGKWQEHKHSENWEGTPEGEGSGLKYKDMLEIYMYIKYIRHENEKLKDDLLHLLLCKENYKTWWSDCDEVYDGEKCVKHESQRLANFKVDWNYSKCCMTDEIIYAGLAIGEGYDSKIPELYADNLTINTTQLETTSDEYREDFDILYKIERELVELDNKYAKKILDIREYLWW